MMIAGRLANPVPEHQPLRGGGGGTDAKSNVSPGGEAPKEEEESDVTTEEEDEATTDDGDGSVALEMEGDADETTRLYTMSDEEDGLVRYNKFPPPPPDLGGRSSRRGKQKAYPKELKKTVIAVVIMCLSFLSTTASLSVVHEFLPDYKPLPDVVLDHLSYQSWALKASEIVLQVQTILAAAVVIFHRHRTIVLRRIALIMSLLYGYRAVTMFVTVLPKANPSYYCTPKLSGSNEHLTFITVFWRVAKLVSGFGLSMNGRHTFCGDFIFSGHTLTLVLSQLVVQEYTSRRFWPMHWLISLSTMLGVAFLLLGRGHYSIDVIIAYWITTRLWYMVHSMACHEQLKHSTNINYFARMWWWPLFRWFEGNVKTGPLPHGFDFPLPVWPLMRKLRYCRAGKQGSRMTSLAASGGQIRRRKLKENP